MQSDTMVGKPSLTSANLVVPLMFLDLMLVVEKPEIVQAKEQKLKSLGQKYVVNTFDILYKLTLHGEMYQV